MRKLRKVASFVHSLQEKKERRKTKRIKVHLFILIAKNKKEHYSFIHSYILVLARKVV